MYQCLCACTRTWRTAPTSGTSEVELRAFVLGLDVDFGEVSQGSELDVLLGLDELNAVEGASWDQTSAVATLGAVRNDVWLDVLYIGDFWWCLQKIRGREYWYGQGQSEQEACTVIV